MKTNKSLPTGVKFAQILSNPDVSARGRLFYFDIWRGSARPEVTKSLNPTLPSPLNIRRII